MAEQGKESLDTSFNGVGLQENPSSLEAELKKELESDRVSISEFNEVDFRNYEVVNSPGASSTSSEPIYVRQPGFDHHAHEFTITDNLIQFQKQHHVKKLHPSIQQVKSPVTLRSNFFQSPPNSPLSLDSPMLKGAEAVHQPIEKQPSFDAIDKETSASNKQRSGNHSPPNCSSQKGTKKKKSNSENKDNVKSKYKKGKKVHKCSIYACKQNG